MVLSDLVRGAVGPHLAMAGWYRDHEAAWERRGVPGSGRAHARPTGFSVTGSEKTRGAGTLYRKNN